MKFERSSDKVVSTGYIVQDLTPHKQLRIGVMWNKYEKLGSTGIGIQLNFRSRGDCPGFRFAFGIHRFSFEVDLHDDRSWNYRENRFMTPEEAEYQKDAYN